MIGTRHVAATFALISMLAVNPTHAAAEPDELMPGSTVLIRYGVIAKFIAPAPAAYDLPDGNNAPNAEGATLSIFDTGSSDSDVYALPSGGWKGLGSPPGSTGWKYKGAGTIPDPCKVVLVKQNLVKAVCRGRGVELITPFLGDVGIVLAVGTDTKNYCARFGGVSSRNDASFLKAKDAPAPGACPTPGAGSSTTTSSTVIGSSTTSTTVGGPCCGGFDFAHFVSDGVQGATCGTVRSTNGTEYTPVTCGGLYIGGGQNSVPMPLSTPNNLGWTVGLTNCVGQTATVVPTTSVETGSNRKCSDTGCFFGGPLTIPNASSTPTSSCVVISIPAPTSGTLNCSAGTADIDIPLAAEIFLTGDTLGSVPGIQPCPLCQGGTVGVPNSGVCNGGANNGMACTPDNTDANGINGMDPSYPTSQDCPPSQAFNIGTIPIGLALDSGTVSWVGTSANNPASVGQSRVFCGYCRNPETGGFKVPFQQCWENGSLGPACTAPTESCQQRSQGAFGPNGGAVKTITSIGVPAGSVVDGNAHELTLASVFCIPPTNNPTADAAADLPGPAAATLHGDLKLCASANPCP
jgi:hypothetical protein